MNLTKYYNNKALNYVVSKPRMQKILELSQGVKNKNILDIGCADGSLGKIYKVKKNYVAGVDISKKAIQQAKKVLDEAVVIDLNDQKLPFKNKQFDLIICSEVVEHLFSRENLLKEIKRVLKDDGELIITTPNILYWGHRLNFLKGNFDYTYEGPLDESHVHFYTAKSLTDEIKNFGFVITNHNHVYLGNTILSKFKNLVPAVFAYQLVFLVKKK